MVFVGTWYILFDRFLAQFAGAETQAWGRVVCGGGM